MSSDVKTTTFSPAETESVGDKLGYGKDSKERLPWEHYLRASIRNQIQLRTIAATLVHFL